MKEVKRVPTQVHTRKLDRLVAHAKMKQGGWKHVNKVIRRKTTDAFGHSIDYVIPSDFSEHWRQLCNS